MLGESNICATLAVKNLDRAKKFYEQTLGLTKLDENPGGVMYKSGNSQLFVYPSDFAGTNKATSASWETKNIEKTVEELKSKGITLEHYDDLEGVTRQGDIHIMGPMKAVWFKDPDGNIFNVGQMG